jgi:hypothetical protein
MKNSIIFFTLAAFLFLASAETNAQSNGNAGQNNSNGGFTEVSGVVLADPVTKIIYVFVDGVAFSPVNLHGMMQSGQVVVGQVVTLKLLNGGGIVLGGVQEGAE